MKTFLLFACFLMTGSAFAQQPDTIFLKRPNELGHAIFIDPNPNSIYYKKIADTAYTLQDSEYKESIRRLDSYKVKTAKPGERIGIPLHWCKLHLYKGKYYLYAPSDWSDLKISLNDSVLIEMAMERTIYAYRSFNKTGPSSYKIVATAEYNGGKNAFVIHIIDHEKGIAVFEHLSSGKDSRAWAAVMVDVNKITQLPVIVNYSPQHKEMEFKFDEPDFNALLKEIK